MLLLALLVCLIAKHNYKSCLNCSMLCISCMHAFLHDKFSLKIFRNKSNRKHPAASQQFQKRSRNTWRSIFPHKVTSDPPQALTFYYSGPLEGLRLAPSLYLLVPRLINSPWSCSVIFRLAFLSYLRYFWYIYSMCQC